MRQKQIQQINDHFDTLNAQGLGKIEEEAAEIRVTKSEIEKKLKDVSSRLQTVDMLLTENSSRLAVEGKAVLDELTQLQNIPLQANTHDIRDVQVSLVETVQLNVKQAVSLRHVPGKHTESTSLCRPLSLLKQNTFSYTKDVVLTADPNLVRYILGQVWCCQNQANIQICKNTEHDCFTDSKWDDVCDVTELPTGTVALAGRGGLYELTSSGETRTTIHSKNKYNSCVFTDGKLFAYCYRPARLMVYKLENGTWQRCDMISLKSVDETEYVTLASSNNKLFVCEMYAGRVLVLSLSGEVQQTFGENGSYAPNKITHEKVGQSEN